MYNYFRVVIVLTVLLPTAAGYAAEKGASSGEIPVITLFAAASLTDVLTALIDSFGNDGTVKVRVNTASSGTLARQIEQGGRADLFLSANRLWMEYADRLGYIKKGMKKEIAHNRLVLITPADRPLKTVTVDSSLDFTALLGKGRLSMGDPAHVPAGMYAKEALDYFGWYAALENRLLPAKDVRSALMMVEMGEAPAGIVYLTDAIKSAGVTIIGTFPERSHRPIVYMAGVCGRSADGQRFFDYLNSVRATPIWRAYGFIR